MRKLVLLFLSLLFITLTAWADLPDDAGIKFRSFTHKFVEATNPLNTLDVSTYQMVRLSDFFEQNPNIIQDFLDGKDIDAIYNEKGTAKRIADELKPGATFSELVSEMVENRNNKIRNLIIENTEIVKWIAQGNTIDDLMDRARLFSLTNEVAADSSINKAIGQELEKTIKKIIEEMPGVFAADSDIAARTYANSIQELVDSGKLAPAIGAFDQLPLESRKKIMQQVSDDRFNIISKKIDTAILDMDISKSSSIENIKNADFNIPNKDMKELAEVLASKYFDKDMPYTTKRRILEAVLALKPAEHFDQLEKTVLKNTDILFQKSLQFFTTKSNNPTLKRIGMALKSDLPFLEQADIDFILKEMYGEAASELTNLRQVAAATTGVGILAEHNGKKVFIKIQRPGLIESTSRDSKRILQLVSGKVEAQNIVKSISKGVFEELDLRMEAFNYEVAKIIYQDPSKGMYIPDIIKDFEPSAKVMVMQVADGTDVSRIDLSKLSDEDFLKLGKSYEEQLRLWFERSMHLDLLPAEEKIKIKKEISNLYKTYFKVDPKDETVDKLMRIFNGDLHGGNVFFKADASSPTGYKINWIDWGNVHYLDNFQARGQIELMLGTINRNPNAIIDAMSKVMEINSDQERKFYDLLQELMREADAKNMPTDMVMNRSVSAALQAGIEPPESIINWGRGKGMLQFKIEDDLNKELLTNRKHLLTANFKGFKTDKVMLEVVAKNVKKNIPGQVVSRTARQEAVLTVNALLRFIKDKGVFLLKKYCNLDLTRRR